VVQIVDQREAVGDHGPAHDVPLTPRGCGDLGDRVAPKPPLTGDRRYRADPLEVLMFAGNYAIIVHLPAYPFSTSEQYGLSGERATSAVGPKIEETGAMNGDRNRERGLR
jgi:hypothetical protein